MLKIRKFWITFKPRFCPSKPNYELYPFKKSESHIPNPKKLNWVWTNPRWQLKVHKYLFPSPNHRQLYMSSLTDSKICNLDNQLYAFLCDDLWTNHAVWNMRILWKFAQICSRVQGVTLCKEAESKLNCCLKINWH